MYYKYMDIRSSELFDKLASLNIKSLNLGDIEIIDGDAHELSWWHSDEAEEAGPDEKYEYPGSFNYFPEELAKIESLNILSCKGLNISKLPSAIGLLINLKNLDVSGNALTELPREIGRLTNLTALDLSNNLLTALPPEIERLSNLISLDISCNKFVFPPKEINKLTNLSTLKA